MSTPVESAFSTNRSCTWPNRMTRAFVESAIRHDAIRDSGGHRDGRLLDSRARGTTAVVDLGEELEVPDADGAGDGHFGVGVHRERDHAVDVARGQTRILERVQDGLGGQSKLAAAGVLGEVRGADTGDRGLTG